MPSVSHADGGLVVSDADFMRLAIRVAQRGIAAGQTPFGAVVVRGGAVAAEGHNTVWRDTDPTAHAEVVAVRRAAAALGRIDLGGCVMYTTCEPCPMCLSAIHWSKIDVVYFGATIADAQAAGFHELCVAAKVLAEMGGSPLRVEGGLVRAECADLFAQWKAAGLSAPY
jgi:guanine deaminase